jgi:hypothetical protein
MGHIVIEDTAALRPGVFLAARSTSGAATPPPSSTPSRRPRPRPLRQNADTSWATRRRQGLPPPISSPPGSTTSSRAVAQFLAGYDVLLTPTNTCLPLPFGAHGLDAPGATVRTCSITSPRSSLPRPLQRPGPALSLPLHVSRAGLPIGTGSSPASAGDDAAHLAAALGRRSPWRGSVRYPSPDSAASVHADSARACATTSCASMPPSSTVQSRRRLVRQNLFSPAEVAVLRTPPAASSPRTRRLREGRKVRRPWASTCAARPCANLVPPRFVQPARRALGGDGLYVMQAKVNVRRPSAATSGNGTTFATHHREDRIPKPLPLQPPRLHSTTSPG